MKQFFPLLEKFFENDPGSDWNKTLSTVRKTDLDNQINSVVASSLRTIVVPPI